MGFSEFLNNTALNRSAFLLYLSDDAQTYKIVAHSLKGGAPK